MQQRISTADTQPGKRLDFWRSWLSSSELGAVAIEDCHRDNFWAECRASRVGNLTIGRFTASAMTLLRSPSLIRSFNVDHFVAVVTDRAPRLFEQNGYSTGCNDGDVFLIDATKPYKIHHDRDLSVTSVYIPRQQLQAVLGPTDAAAGLVLNGRSPVAQLIGGYVRNLASVASDLDQEAAKRLASIGVDLIAAGFAERAGACDLARCRPGAAIVRARALIEEMLHNPGLDAASIARAMGLSKRRLYEIFMGEDLSIVELIWERRLVRAAQMLASDRKAMTPIAEIAFRTGFSTAAHFSRRFKKRFEDTPAQYREKRSSNETRSTQRP